MAGIQELMIRDVIAPGDTLHVTKPDTQGHIAVSISVRDPENQLIWLDKDNARELFNWLGVWLHSYEGNDNAD